MVWGSKAATVDFPFERLRLTTMRKALSGCVSVEAVWTSGLAGRGVVLPELATIWAAVMGRKAGTLLAEASKSGEGDDDAYESSGRPCQGAAPPGTVKTESAAIVARGSLRVAHG